MQVTSWLQPPDFPHMQHGIGEWLKRTTSTSIPQNRTKYRDRE